MNSRRHCIIFSVPSGNEALNMNFPGFEFTRTSSISSANLIRSIGFNMSIQKSKSGITQGERFSNRLNCNEQLKRWSVRFHTYIPFSTLLSFDSLEMICDTNLIRAKSGMEMLVVFLDFFLLNINILAMANFFFV